MCEPQELYEVISKQAIEILELKKQLTLANTERNAREQWKAKAKHNAGYPGHVSFDDVWADALKALKASKNEGKG